MESKEKMASTYYFEMLKNYQMWRSSMSCGARGRFMNAAKALCELDMPNPFKESATRDNAQARPSAPGSIVTGVVEG